ncbi:MAG: hypothetical protein OXF02_04185 [Simkaniaceae bacterium]|nr:hypothetical protein [Simkaniaceae bacterium]
MFFKLSPLTKSLAYVVAFSVVGLVTLAAVMVVRSGNEGDYYETDALFTDRIEGYEGAPTLDKSFRRLATYIKKHPEIAPKYEGKIAQRFIAFSVDGATPFGERVIARTKLPYYDAYSSVSLLIYANRFREALTESVRLKERMLRDDLFLKTNSRLFASNLLRLPFLYQELGLGSEEREAWREWKGYAGWEKGEPKDARIARGPFADLAGEFSVGESTLREYVAHRESGSP